MKRYPIPTYIIVFLITLCIIVAVLFVSTTINRAKTDQLKTDENKIAIDIFALEAKIDLVKEAECQNIDTSGMSGELRDLSARINFMERQVSENDQTIFRLKRYFALLEIKNYLINTKLAKQCGQSIPSIIYIYERSANCPECLNEEFTLDALAQSRPDINIYNLDYRYDTEALKAYTSITSLPAVLPILIVNGKVYPGFTSLETLNLLLPKPHATST